MSCIGQDKSGVPLSIILTVYNGEQYLNAAIQSILTQTLTDFEFIIVDDGSTDQTKEIITTFNDPRIKFYSLDHIGRAAALNYAIRQIQSPLIAFMDADDIALPERLKEQYNVLQRHPEIGVASCWYQLIDERGNMLYTVRRLPEQHADIEYEMTKHPSMCFPATMMRRELYDVIGGFNESYRSAIDYEFFLHLLPITNFYNLQKILFQYRIHSQAISIKRKDEQRVNTLNIANDYLLHKLHNNRTINDQYIIKFRLGLNEYYHGSMRRSRHWFIQVLPKMGRHWLLWRYWLPTFFGDKLFSIYRSYL